MHRIMYAYVSKVFEQVGNIPMLGSWCPLKAFSTVLCNRKLQFQKSVNTPKSMLNSQAWTIVIMQAFQMADLPNSCLPVT
jgi:hypothetical protein